MQVVAQGLGHSFTGSNYLFKNLDFEFTPGDMVGLVGPSGSGKSTLLGIIAGWIQPTVGSVDLQDVTSMTWVFQNPMGVRYRSVLDHVVLPILATGLSRGEAEEQAFEIMGRFGLQPLANKRFCDLSGGEAQRLMLARATAKNADLLLVDEPTAQLDRALASTVNEVLSELSSNSSIVIVATHDAGTSAACKTVLDLGHYAPVSGVNGQG